MPNHVTTEIVLSPEAAQALTRPATPEEVSAAEADRGKSYYQPVASRVVDFERIIPGRNTAEEGWYSWSIKNWGTKSNAYSQNEDPAPQPGDLVLLRFDTAWSHPLPVIAALAAQFPDDPMYVRYADEDSGSNMCAYVVWGEEFWELRTDDTTGLLPDGLVQELAERGADVSRCIDWAAPVQYDRSRTEAQNQAARDWAIRLRYRQTVWESDVEGEGWYAAWAETEAKFGSDPAARMTDEARAYLRQREAEIIAERLAALPAHQRFTPPAAESVVPS